MDQPVTEVRARPHPPFVEATSLDAEHLSAACREMVSDALDYCRQKTRLPGHAAVVRSLKTGNRAARDYLHYALAKEIGSYLGHAEAAVKAVHLFEPESVAGEDMDEQAILPQDLQLIVWVDGDKGTLQTLIQAIGVRLAEECREWLAPAPGTKRSFLQAEIIDDHDVEQRRGGGALIASIHTQPIKVWSRFVIRLNPDHCGQCHVCSSVCPYDAITLSPEVSVAKIDVEKCQLCGLCFSACPAGAIESAFYDLATLVRNVQSSAKANGFKAIALSCRGSTPTSEEIEQIVGVPGYVPICLPCVGRTPTEFFLKALSIGIERIAVIPCKDNHCRFEDGSRIIRTRLMLLRSLLQGLAYDPELLILSEGQEPQATVNTVLCAGCGTCLSVCPYGAIHPERQDGRATFVAGIDPALCQGCGICLVACPSRAIETTRLTNPQILTQIERALATTLDDGNPRIIGFRCNWCSFGDADLPFEQRYHSSQNIEVVPVPCAGRVDPLHVLWAFLNGADGVLLAGCPSEDCRYGSGSDQAETRVAKLKELLESRGVDSRRLRLERLKRDTPDALGDTFRSFASEIQGLLPPTIQHK